MKSAIDALLIEDSPSDAQLVKAIVSSSNSAESRLHHVERFSEALALLETNTFDIVLLDLNLPDGQGLPLIKQLKQHVPEIPIVILTGLDDQTVAEAALQEGAQDYVVKSDTLSPTRVSQLGHANVGNLLVQRIHYAIKRAESNQKAAARQERYALIAQEANDGIWDWDLTTNRVYYSDQWCSLLGISRSSITDSPEEWLSRIHPEDREHFEQKIHDYLTRRQRQFQYEYRIRHDNGEYLWVLTRGVARWDQTGKAYRIAGSQTDMTVRTALAHTPQQQEFPQSVLHSIAIGLLTNLAGLYLEEQRYHEAASLLEGILTMRKWLLGEDHIDVVLNIYQLAILYDNQGRYQKAKLFYQDALQLFEKNLGPQHPTTNLVRLKVALINRINQALDI